MTVRKTCQAVLKAFGISIYLIINQIYFLGRIKCFTSYGICEMKLRVHLNSEIIRSRRTACPLRYSPFNLVHVNQPILSVILFRCRSTCQVDLLICFGQFNNFTTTFFYHRLSVISFAFLKRQLSKLTYKQGF